MSIFKFSEGHFIYGLLTLCVYCIRHTDESKPGRADYLRDEKLFYHQYEYNNELKWIWSVKSFCRFFRPRLTSVDDEGTHLATKEILLEAPGCVKVEMQTLVCHWRPRRSGRDFWFLSPASKYYAIGPYGDIYELRPARGVCNDIRTLIIYKRIPNYNAFFSRPLKLNGVARILEAVNTIRILMRRWSQDHSPEDISDYGSDDSSDEDGYEEDDEENDASNSDIISEYDNAEVRQLLGTVVQTILDM